VMSRNWCVDHWLYGIFTAGEVGSGAMCGLRGFYCSAGMDSGDGFGLDVSSRQISGTIRPSLDPIALPSYL
jgi:hypothetical protein